MGSCLLFGPQLGHRSSTTTMKLCLSLMIVSLSALICESYNIDHTMDMNKRGYRDPDDPRNLFAAMYGGVYKRAPAPAMDVLDDVSQADRLHFLKSIVNKRGLRDPDDPRNLFHSVYGGVF